jgi:N-acetylmuramoyl-L-alanine amidase
VLIECGFMTDREDLAFIANPKNQEHIAKTILEGIVSYQGEKDIKRIDTVPNKKKTKESVNIQGDESNAEAEKRIATDKKLQDQRRELEIAQRKMAESLADTQRQRGVIQKKQSDIQLRAKMDQLQQDQRNLETKQKQIQALQEMKIQKTAVVEKQKELELRQRLLEQAIEKKSSAVERETKELNLMKHLAEQQSIQKQQQILLEQQLKLDIQRQQLKEAEIKKIEEKNREMMELQNQREVIENVLQKDDLKKSGMPEKKKPANNRSTPKSDQKAND